MPSYEHFSQEQFFPAAFDLEASSAESLASHTMEFDWNMAPTYHNDASFHLAGTLPTNMEVPVEDIEYDMARTASNGSAQPQIHEFPPTLYQSESNRSPSSSAVSSPYSTNVHMAAMHDNYQYPGTFIPTTIVSEDNTFADYNIPEDYKLAGVDPNMLDASEYHYNNSLNVFSQISHQSYAGSFSSPSPVPSHVSYNVFHQPVAAEPYFQARSQRGTSVLSHVSGPTSPRTSLSGDEDNGEKGRCTWPECGRQVKDLKAHMLTHQSERPEKCPIVSCEYHVKGFARKYDKNRHVLVHYKGSMVCGFCPGSGSSDENSFNRADVFKRHLTKVHGVDKAPPNSKRRNPSSSNDNLSSYCADATGKCSTCSQIFNNAQDFYNHLDECLFRVVEQVGDSERINEMRLGEMNADPALKETLARNGVKLEDNSPQYGEEEGDEFNQEDDDYDDEEADDPNERCGKGIFKTVKLSGNRAIIGGKINKNRTGKKGMTWSKGGVPLVCKGRKRRKHYPPSWGISVDKMKMKKRGIYAFDGPRRLLKDDIMLHKDHEVRMPLEDESRWITDLDVETLNRANAFHNATAEEKGTEEEVWLQEQELNY